MVTTYNRVQCNTIKTLTISLRASVSVPTIKLSELNLFLTALAK